MLALDTDGFAGDVGLLICRILLILRIHNVGATTQAGGFSFMNLLLDCAVRRNYRRRVWAECSLGNDLRNYDCKSSISNLLV